MLDRQSWYFRFQDHQQLYKSIYTKHKTQGFARVAKRANTIEFMSRGELSMTLNDLVYGLHGETNIQQIAVYTQLFQNACVDGALLRLFEGQTPNDSFHSVSTRWIALRSPLSRIFHARDFLYFEYCFTTLDTNGRTVLIEYKESKPFSVIDHDLDITRGAMFVLNTYYMENGCVVMHSLGQHSLAGICPIGFAVSLMPATFGRIHNHRGLAYARTLADACVITSALAGPDNFDATSC